MWEYLSSHMATVPEHEKFVKHISHRFIPILQVFHYIFNKFVLFLYEMVLNLFSDSLPPYKCSSLHTMLDHYYHILTYDISDITQVESLLDSDTQYNNVQPCLGQF